MRAQGTLTCPHCGKETDWPLRCNCQESAATQSSTANITTASSQEDVGQGETASSASSLTHLRSCLAWINEQGVECGGRCTCALAERRIIANLRVQFTAKCKLQKEIDSVVECLSQLVELKRIKRLVEAKTATSEQHHHYEEHKEQAWGDAEQAITNYRQSCQVKL